MAERVKGPGTGRLQNDPPTEPPIPVPAKVVDGKTKVHVDLYLRAKGVPLWERPGKHAFAKENKQEFATDAEFDELFKKY